MFTNEELLEEFAKTRQIVIDDEFGPLGAGGMRALCTAIMGTGAGMINHPFKARFAVPLLGSPTCRFVFPLHRARHAFLF